MKPEKLGGTGVFLTHKFAEEVIPQASEKCFAQAKGGPQNW